MLPPRSLLLLLGALSCASPAPAAPCASLTPTRLIAAAGLDPVRTYPLDDGRGIEFRGPHQPPFALEFRRGRINVAWTPFADDPAKAAMDADNLRAAGAVLAAALGAPDAHRVLTLVSEHRPGQIVTECQDIRISAGSGSILVSLQPTGR